MNFAAALALGASLAGAAPSAFQSIVVQPGDTLWAIAQRYLKDPKRWDELLSYNTLPTRDPTVALPGMTLRVPIELVKEQMRAAKLILMRNEVLLRRRETADWNRAKLEMDLFPEDGLRTTTAAEARVQFSAGELLTLGENSMVILSPPKKESDLKLLQGEVRGHKARVLTSSALIVPKTADASFSARVKDDLTTLVQVYQGKAAVEAQGKTVELNAGFASEVELDKPPSSPIPLPDLPEFANPPAEAPAPVPEMVMRGTTLSLKLPPAPPEIPAPTAERGRLSAVAVGRPIQAYHVQIAADREFAKVAYDKRFSALQSVDLNTLPLPEGQLYWRVALIDLLGFEGQFSPPRPYIRGSTTLDKP